MTYLVDRRGLPTETANNVYALFGGRIKSLQNAASKLEGGIPFDSKSVFSTMKVDTEVYRDFLTDIRKSVLQDTARRIEKIKCRNSMAEQKFMFNVLCGLRNRHELTVDELVQIENDVTIRQKILDELRNETILIRSVSAGSYTCHSQVIRVCIEEHYKNTCLHCKA
jgi:hypothetical protein